MQTVLSRHFIRICFQATILSLFLLLVRYILIHDDFFWFLPWNLGLAWIPLGISSVMTKRSKKVSSVGRQGVLCGLWLLFYPNAAYIVTDLVHLKARPGVSSAYDFLLIAAFAITGLLLAYISLAQLHQVVKRRWGKMAGWFFVGVVMAMTSFGIYLGRVLRWNSWDVFTHPAAVFSDIVYVLHALTQPLTMIVMLIFSAALFLFYASLRWASESHISTTVT